MPIGPTIPCGGPPYKEPEPQGSLGVSPFGQPLVETRPSLLTSNTNATPAYQESSRIRRSLASTPNATSAYQEPFNAQSLVTEEGVLPSTNHPTGIMFLRNQILNRLLPKKSYELKAIEEHLIHRLQISKEILEELKQNNRKNLMALVREEIQTQGLNENELVFRALSHPQKNITEQLLVKYGTDRFVGYRSGHLPQKDLNLVPFINQGQKESLTADTYSVPNLEWALGFAGLKAPDDIQRFLNNQLVPFLIMYKSDLVHTELTPGGKSGEQWRTTFLAEPTQALASVIRFLPQNR